MQNNGLSQKIIDSLARPARLIFHQEDDGWWVESPDLPGFYTSGDTFEELQHNIYDAVQTYFDLPDKTSELKERLLIKNELASQLQLV